MQHKKQPPVQRVCRNCGAKLLGKYVTKNHICRPKRDAISREEGLSQQRKSR